jgi:hypothetical protein
MNRLNVKDIRNLVRQGTPIHDISMKVNPEAALKWLDIIWKGRMVKINSKGKIREIKKRNTRRKS